MTLSVMKAVSAALEEAKSEYVSGPFDIDAAVESAAIGPEIRPYAEDVLGEMNMDEYELYRANRFLEKNLSSVFSEHLASIRSADAALRATLAYNEEYLLSLPIPLPAVFDLVQSLIAVVTSYKQTVPGTWLRLSKGDISIIGSTPTYVDVSKRASTD